MLILIFTESDDQSGVPVAVGGAVVGVIIVFIIIGVIIVLTIIIIRR